MKFGELPNMRWVAAAAVSIALHFAVLVAPPLASRFGSHQGQFHSSVGTQHIAARVIEETPSISDSPTPTAAMAAMAANSDHQLANAGAGIAESPAAYEKTWRPDPDTRFYTIVEVDQPALPVLNWEFPPQNPVSIQLRHLVVQVWIAENGNILNVTLLSSEPQITRTQKQNIERSLIQTQMTPATKNGQQVASQRTLEMALEF